VCVRVLCVCVCVYVHTLCVCMFLCMYVYMCVCVRVVSVCVRISLNYTYIPRGADEGTQQDRHAPGTTFSQCLWPLVVRGPGRQQLPSKEVKETNYRGKRDLL
jgi:hypothetical protein